MNPARRTVATTLATLTVVAVPVTAVAQADLVVQKSLAGVKLGMTRAQVEKVLGEPSAVSRPTNEIFGRYTELRYGLTRVSLFDGEDGTVFSVTTTSKKQRTSRGVGVGSTEKVLRQKVKGVRCETYAGRFRICTVGTASPGRTVTDFRIGLKSKKVARITLGTIID